MKYKIPFTDWYLFKPETSLERFKRLQKNPRLCNDCGKKKSKYTKTKSCEDCLQRNRANRFNKRFRKELERKNEINQKEYENLKKEKTVSWQD